MKYKGRIMIIKCHRTTVMRKQRKKTGENVVISAVGAGKVTALD